MTRTDASPWRDEFRATLALAGPLAATQLAQIAITTTDVLMMGWLGPGALAAGALGANVYFVLGTFCIGVVMATAPLIAQAIGRGRHVLRDVRRSVRQGLWAALGLGLPCCVALWHTRPILMLLGQDAANAGPAEDYARAMVWGFIPALWFMVLRCFVSALERPRSALVISLLTVATNAFGAWVLMFGKFGLPALGVVGAGIASSITQVLSLVLMLGYVQWDRRLRRYRLFGRIWRPDWPRLAALFRLGLPIGVTLTVEFGVFAAALLLMGLLGTAEIAAHQIAIQVAAATFMVPFGIGQAATVRVGLAIGRGDPGAARRAGHAALALGLVFNAITAVVLWTAARPIVGLFLDLDRPENAAVIALAVSFLAVAALFQLVDGVQAIAGGALRGLADTRVPMMLAAFGYWAVAFPASALLAFPLGLGGIGIWIGLALGLGVVAALASWRFAWRVGGPRPLPAVLRPRVGA